MKAPLAIPTDQKKLVAFANEMVETCRISSGSRSAFCRWISQIVALGRDQGKRSLLNMMYNHLDRYQSFLYSPIHLNFQMEFENKYPPPFLSKGAVAANAVTDLWKKSNTDRLFGLGVFEAGKYGSCFVKQWVEEEGEEKTPQLRRRLVMPWQFGVYREDETELDNQSVLCETVYLTLPEIWRRIWHLPAAEKIFARIKAQAHKGEKGDEFNSFVHQVLSTSVLQTSGAGVPKPGGIMSVSNDAGYAVMGAEIGAELVQMHELWVQGEDDYVTIQFIPPDTIIAPLFAHSNLLIPGKMQTGLHPYTMIQPNPRAGYLWGKSELEELIEPQNFLSVLADDTQKLSGLQIDKILGLVGYEGPVEELRDALHEAGAVNLPVGGSVTDLTPKLMPEQLQLIKAMIDFIYMLGGMPPIMQGQGEQGVRAGVHADTLLKTGSPRLRDSSLGVERQCAQAADLTYSIMRAKYERKFWTKAESVKDIEESSFRLTDIPDDGKITVDSHSSSPIFRDDHQQVIGFALKSGLVTGHYAIDHLDMPDKDRAHSEFDEKQRQQKAMMQDLMQNHPEVYEKLLQKQLGGAHR